MDEHTFTVPNGKGTYSLILALDEDIDTAVGALGTKKFLARFYAYTGSARGAGGFARVKRHLGVAAGNNLTVTGISITCCPIPGQKEYIGDRLSPPLVH